jgi:hypothetical protein
MIVCVKSVCLFVLYLGIGVTRTDSKYNLLSLVLAAYHLIMIIPQVYQIHVYNLKERTIPGWSYIYRFTFHYLLYDEEKTRAFPSVLCIYLIAILKDIVFLIQHAEKRIAKIDEILYEDKYDKRIVHLHNNVIVEDSNNRFHQHCFDTNKLYLEAMTPSTERQVLAIDNYRDIRKKQNSPKDFQDDDETYYRASSNKYIFISQRYTFFIMPIALIVWCACMADTRGTTPMYINHSIVLIDLLTMYFGNEINDVAIDVSYAIAMVYLIAHE